jgi:hypothetical protein
MSEIEAKPVLWKTASEQYSNKISKRSAWEEVILGLNFLPHFEEKTIAKKIDKLTLLHVFCIVHVFLHILHTFINFTFI